MTIGIGLNKEQKELLSKLDLNNKEIEAIDNMAIDNNITFKGVVRELFQIREHGIENNTHVTSRDIAVSIALLQLYKNEIKKIVNPVVSYNSDSLVMDDTVIENNAEIAEGILNSLDGLVDWENTQ